MEFLKDFDVVYARITEDGSEEFADTGTPAERVEAGAIESRWVWDAPPGFSLPGNLGGAPEAMSFPGPGASRFGIVCWPPHSAGKRRFAGGGPNVQFGEHADPAMHATDTLDYDIVLSGKVDLELGNGQVRTVGPGTCIILGGVAHAWKNRYDEPCVIASVLIGTDRTEA
jgi:hypothetical protein